MNERIQESDRELLRDAAKAAGIELWHEDVFIDGLTQKVSDNGVLQWNPLLNDGDAFRLAVLLKLCIDHDFVETGTFTFNGITEGEYEAGVKVWRITSKEPDINIEEVYGGDAHAATRRAIVRAAAAIGRNMV